MTVKVITIYYLSRVYQPGDGADRWACVGKVWVAYETHFKGFPVNVILCLDQNVVSLPRINPEKFQILNLLNVQTVCCYCAEFVAVDGESDWEMLIQHPHQS